MSFHLTSLSPAIIHVLSYSHYIYIQASSSTFNLDTFHDITRIDGIDPANVPAQSHEWRDIPTPGDIGVQPRPSSPDHFATQVDPSAQFVPAEYRDWTPWPTWEQAELNVPVPAEGEPFAGAGFTQDVTPEVITPAIPTPDDAMAEDNNGSMVELQHMLDDMDRETRALIEIMLADGTANPTMDWEPMDIDEAVHQENDQQLAGDAPERDSEDEEDSGDEDGYPAVADDPDTIPGGAPVINNGPGTAHDPTAHFVDVNRGDAVEESNECPACLSPVEPGEVVYLTCGHQWCRACLNQNLSAALRSREDFPPRCCDALPNGIDITPVQHHLENDVLMRLFEVGEEFASPDPTFCAKPRCGLFIPVPEGQESEQWAVCNKCEASTCTECKGARDAHTTPGEHPSMVSKEDLELGEKQGWKQCPNRKCQMLVERVEGCDHMTCKCLTEFCYECGDRLEPEADGVQGMACNCNGQNPWVPDVQQFQDGDVDGEADGEEGWEVD